MAQAPPWLPGIILKAEGYTAEWYKKMVEKQPGSVTQYEERNQRNGIC